MAGRRQQRLAYAAAHWAAPLHAHSSARLWLLARVCPARLRAEQHLPADGSASNTAAFRRMPRQHGSCCGARQQAQARGGGACLLPHAAALSLGPCPPPRHPTQCGRGCQTCSSKDACTKCYTTSLTNGKCTRCLDPRCDPASCPRNPGELSRLARGAGLAGRRPGFCSQPAPRLGRHACCPDGRSGTISRAPLAR